MSDAPQTLYALHGFENDYFYGVFTTPQKAIAYIQPHMEEGCTLELSKSGRYIGYMGTDYKDEPRFIEQFDLTECTPDEGGWLRAR